VIGTPPPAIPSTADFSGAGAELFLYPSDQHYFADSSLPSYDPEATALLMERVLAFLARV
jgi:dienelactone hydrolase